MTPTELEHVRADIANAIVENRYDDPAAPVDMLGRLLDEVGALATDPLTACYPALVDGQNRPRQTIQDWASDLLRSVQLRAVSQKPYGEPANDDEPHWSEHL